MLSILPLLLVSGSFPEQKVTPPARAELTLSRRVFDMNEEIRPRFVVKNESRDVITLWSCGFSFNHRLILKDEAGRVVKRTELGDCYAKSFSPSGPRRKNVPIELRPGATYEENPSDPLQLLFDLSKPGEYSLQVVYEEATLPWVGRIESNVATFEIRKK